MSDSMTGFGRKAVLASLFVALLAIFAGVMVYRLNNPSLQQVAHQAPPSGDEGQAMGGAGMGQIQQYMALLEEDPNNFDALTGVGNAFLMMRAWDRAATNLEKALSVRPDAFEVKGALGFAYFNQGKYEDAARLYTEMVTERPDDAMARFNLGVILKHGLNKGEEGDAQFKALLAIKGAEADLVQRATKELSGEKAE